MRKQLVLLATILVVQFLMCNKASGEWYTETIDSTGQVGDMPSLAIDESNNLHIIYCNTDNYELKYASNSSGTWTKDIIDNITTGWAQTDIAIDSSGVIHVIYIVGGGTREDVKYANNELGNWTTELVSDESEYDIHSCSIAIDSSDNVHIIYVEEGILYYSAKNSGSWTKKMLAEDASISTSIAIDHSNHIHISYYSNTKNLVYISNKSGEWVSEIVDDNGSVGLYNSITTDLSGNVHISYHSVSNYNLKYANNINNEWKSEIVEDSFGETYVGIGTSILVDQSNYVHISYYNNNLSGLRITDSARYSTNISGEWRSEIIKDNILIYNNSTTSLSIDSNGKVHIAFYDDYLNRIGL